MNTNALSREEIIQKLREIYDHVAEKFIPENDGWEFIVEDNRNEYIKKLIDQDTNAKYTSHALIDTVNSMMANPWTFKCTAIDLYNRKVVCFNDRVNDLIDVDGRSKFNDDQFERMVIQSFKIDLVNQFTKIYHKNFDVKKLTQWERAISTIDVYSAFFIGYLSQEMIQWIMTNPNEFETIHEFLDEEGVLTLFINRNSISMHRVVSALKRLSDSNNLSQYSIDVMVSEFYYNDDNSMLFKVVCDDTDNYLLLVDPASDFKSLAQKLRELSRQVDYIGFANVPTYPDHITIKEAIDRIVKRDSKTEE